MADFIDCGTNGYTIDTLLRALYAEVDADGTHGLRIAQKTKKEGGVITCSNKDDFNQLFKRALEVGDDGTVVIRVCVTDFADGAGLSAGDECDQYRSLDLLSRLVFVFTTDDEVALSLLNIT